MRHTFCLAYGRVAFGGDFLNLGKHCRKTPGWRQLAVDFDVIDDRQILYRHAVDLCSNTVLAISNLDQQLQSAIERECRRYANWCATQIKGQSQ